MPIRKRLPAQSTAPFTGASQTGSAGEPLALAPPQPPQPPLPPGPGFSLGSPTDPTMGAPAGGGTGLPGQNLLPAQQPQQPQQPAQIGLQPPMANLPQVAQPPGIAGLPGQNLLAPRAPSPSALRDPSGANLPPSAFTGGMGSVTELLRSLMAQRGR